MVVPSAVVLLAPRRLARTGSTPQPRQPAQLTNDANERGSEPGTAPHWPPGHDPHARPAQRRARHAARLPRRSSDVAKAVHARGRSTRCASRACSVGPGGLKTPVEHAGRPSGGQAGLIANLALVAGGLEYPGTGFTAGWPGALLGFRSGFCVRPRVVPRPPGPGQGRGPPSRAKKPHRRSTPLNGPPGDSTRTQGRPRRPTRGPRRPCSSRATKSASGGPARCFSPSRRARSDQNASVASLAGRNSVGAVNTDVNVG